MSHPCADHPCDHCYLCDVVGICCQTAGQSLFVNDDSDADFRQAILAESASTITLAHLIRVEAALHANRPQPLFLPAPRLALPTPAEARVSLVDPRTKGHTP